MMEAKEESPKKRRSVTRYRMTDAWVRSLGPADLKDSEGKKVPTRDYFDDPSRKSGVRGLLLRQSYGGSKSFRVMFYVDGGKSKTFKLGRADVLTVAQARKAALTFLANPKEHTEKRSPAPTFAKVSSDFLRLYVQKNKLRTARVIEQQINKHLVPRFKNFVFASIRRKDLSELLDKVEADHGAHMADSVLTIFKSIATWHGERDEDYRSPVGKKMRRAKRRSRERILNDDELRALWSVTEELGTYGALLRCALLLGQRRSKINFMKWSDIRDGVWYIDSQENEKPNCGRIKLPSIAAKIIEAQPRFKGNDFVFAATRGRGAFNAFGQFAALLEAKMKTVLPNMPDHSVHDLRRSFRSRLSAIGVDRTTAERCLGHLVGNSVERTYDRHRYETEMDTAFEALANHIVSVVTPPPANVVRLSGGSRR